MALKGEVSIRYIFMIRYLILYMMRFPEPFSQKLRYSGNIVLKASKKLLRWMRDCVEGCKDNATKYIFKI